MKPYIYLINIIISILSLTLFVTALVSARIFDFLL